MGSTGGFIRFCSEFHAKHDSQIAGVAATLFVGAFLSQCLYTFTSMGFSTNPGITFGDEFNAKQRDDCLIAANVLLFASMCVLVFGLSFGNAFTSNDDSWSKLYLLFVFVVFLVAPQGACLYYLSQTTTLSLK